MIETTTSTIKSVGKLVDALRNKPEEKGYFDIMKSIDIPYEEFESFFTWNKDHHTRNCLHVDENFELLLVCWEKDQQSTIHDFDINESWIHTIHGQLKEERFVKPNGRLEMVSSVLIDPDCFTYMRQPISIHRYKNMYESRSVSLNLYSNPVKEWNEYDEETGASKVVSVSYDSLYEFDENGDHKRVD